MMHTPPLPRRAGFTLTELLVVIAIIAILLALVLPIATSSLAKARELSCLTNLGNWGKAVNVLRANDHPWFPTEGIGSQGAILNEATAWFNQLAVLQGETPLADYAEKKLPLPQPGRKSVFLCDSQTKADAEKIKPGQPFLSYAQNLYIEDGNRKAGGPILGKLMRFTMVDEPSDFAYMSETGDPGFPNVDGRFVGYRHGRTKEAKVPAGVQGPRNRANIAFLDGHAKGFGWQEIYVPARSVNKTVIWDPAAPFVKK